MEPKPGRDTDETASANREPTANAATDKIPSTPQSVPPSLSIVVPLFNEVENVVPLVDALYRALKPLGRSFEVLLVDDGSSDGTLAAARALLPDHPGLHVVRFKRNFGQTAAMRAGFALARGSTIVTLDGDLQNDPADIGKLVDQIEQGYDLVIGWRHQRKDPFVSRTMPSRMANKLIGWLTRVNVHDSGCSLKAYRTKMIQSIPLYSEMHRFIPALSTTTGARITEVPVRHHPRKQGKSKYGLSRIGKVLLDVIAIKMLIQFRHRPRHLFGMASIPCLLVAFGAAVAYLITILLGGQSGTILVSSLIMIMFAYLTLHFLLVGLVAELIVESWRMQPHPPIPTRAYRPPSPPTN